LEHGTSTGGFIPLRPFGPDLLCDGPFQGWQSFIENWSTTNGFSAAQVAAISDI
jgi:hypothetical protein